MRDRIEHPLEKFGFELKNYKSFGEVGLHLSQFSPINILIGRNNSGKSSLIDAIEYYVNNSNEDRTKYHQNKPFSIKIELNLEQSVLKQVFPANTRGGEIGGSHWEYGSKFVGATVTYECGPNQRQKRSLEGVDFSGLSEKAKNNYHEQILKIIRWPFEGLKMIKINAERDVVKERQDQNLNIRSGGLGVTNVVRAFINDASRDRKIVQEELRVGLNKIYEGDSIFDNIISQQSDDLWEIYLTEENKGDIALSQSGSSLKTVFIILSIFSLLPRFDTVNWKKVVLCIEEPENNLHPALLRRLLNFVQEKRDELGFCLIITTHSPVCIDWSAKRDDSQIIHIRHNGKSAVGNSATDYVQNRDILDDLDIRASDILQANGVIWVEGPSDRLFLRKWLEIISDDYLKEGIHYNIMFYGGKLLYHLSGEAPKDNDDLISLLSLNRNMAVMIDSDRRDGDGTRKPRMNLNSTKTRIKEEVENLNGFVWITEGKEVENYLPNDLLADLGAKVLPGIYDNVYKADGLQAYDGKKVEFAHDALSKSSFRDLSQLDLQKQLEKLQSHILRWNSA